MSKSSDRKLKLSTSVEKLVQYCESDCVAECCGLDACDFSREKLACWRRDHPQEVDAVLREFDEVLQAIAVQGEDTVSSRAFNAVWAKSEALVFFENLRALLLENA